MSKVRVVGPRIEVAEAKAMVDADEALILDVVASQVWPSMTRTIQGSVRIPPYEIGNRFDELPRDKAIIAYCTGPDEFTSARVASFLEKQGYRAFALKGGYMAWYQAGYPIERKEATAALPVEALCPECGEPNETHVRHQTPGNPKRSPRVQVSLGGGKYKLSVPQVTCSSRAALRSFMETFSFGIHLSSAGRLTCPPSDMDKAVANGLGAIQNRLDQTQDFERLHHS